MVGSSCPEILVFSACTSPTFSSVTVVIDAITSSSLPGSCHHFRDDVPSGHELNGELNSCKRGEPVPGNPEVCNHEVPPAMSSVILLSGWRIVLTCVMAPLDIGLHVFWGNTPNPPTTSSISIPRRPVNWTMGLLVPRQGDRSLCIRDCAIMEFRR